MRDGDRGGSNKNDPNPQRIPKVQLEGIVDCFNAVEEHSPDLAAVQDENALFSAVSFHPGLSKIFSR